MTALHADKLREQLTLWLQHEPLWFLISYPFFKILFWGRGYCFFLGVVHLSWPYWGWSQRDPVSTIPSGWQTRRRGKMKGTETRASLGRSSPRQTNPSRSRRPSTRRPLLTQMRIRSQTMMASEVVSCNRQNCINPDQRAFGLNFWLCQNRAGKNVQAEFPESKEFVCVCLCARGLSCRLVAKLISAWLRWFRFSAAAFPAMRMVL